MRIGVLTGGGDCPGLNGVIRAAVTKGVKEYGYDFVGFRDGWKGPLEGLTMELNLETVRDILPKGGTILGSSRTNPFKIDGGVEKIKENLAKHGIDALIAIGGEDTLGVATKLDALGVKVIGVPKTIDNDLNNTDYTFGFDTAVNIAVEAIDRLHTTAASHKRAIIVQVMGRHAGWIALWGGLAGAADIILIPEIPFSLEKVAEFVEKREAAGFKSTMIVVAEGARTHHGQQFRKQSASGEWRLGGIGEMLAQEVEARSGKETRVCVLGHLQRGGDPTTLDRILGIRFGVKAVQLALEERFGTMVSYQNYEVLDVPIADAVHRLKKVPPDCQLVGTARAMGISFGD